MRALVVASLVLACSAHADPRIGDAAPALELPDGRGHIVRRTPGRVAIIDFSATWCGPCHEALAALLPLVTPELELFIVDVGEDAASVERHYASRTLPATVHVVLDDHGVAATAWGHRRFPTTFLVDGAGVIRFINRGYGPGYPARIAQHLAALH
ncbi:MAG: TlpA disulfide reductase family protein [Polyangia bacterium]